MNTRLTFFILWFEKDISNPVSEKLKRPFFGSESLDTGKKVETNAPSILYFFFFFFPCSLLFLISYWTGKGRRKKCREVSKPWGTNPLSIFFPCFHSPWVLVGKDKNILDGQKSVCAWFYWKGEYETKQTPVWLPFKLAIEKCDDSLS